jgi:hypothetical protein
MCFEIYSIFNKENKEYIFVFHIKKHDLLHYIFVFPRFQFFWVWNVNKITMLFKIFKL